jgi:hypothetical protein
LLSCSVSPCLVNLLVCPNLFRHVFGKFTPKPQTKSITLIVRKLYELYFGCKVGDQDNSWAPHSCCHRCARYLGGWPIGTHRSINFAFPLVWVYHKDHLNDWYLYITKIDGHNSKSTNTIVYPNILSALRPVKHDDSVPILKPPQQWTLHEEEPTSTSPEDEPGPSCSNTDLDFAERNIPHLVSQSELNDLVYHSLNLMITV